MKKDKNLKICFQEILRQNKNAETPAPILISSQSFCQFFMPTGSSN